MHAKLVDVVSGNPDPSLVSHVAGAMGFSSLDYIQLVTESINEAPFTEAACLTTLSGYPCGDPGRVGLSFDTRTGLVPVATASSITSYLTYYGALGTISDSPDQPAGVRLEFDDFLVGVDDAGGIHSVFGSPYISGPLGFAWAYNGSSARTSGFTEQSDTSSDSGVGTATFLGYLNLENLPPGVRDALEEVGLAPSVPEPSTWAMTLLGFVGLGYAAYRRTSAPRSA
jgi:hypothetical protein